MIKDLFDSFLKKIMIGIFIFSIISSIIINFIVNFLIYIEIPSGIKLITNIISMFIILLGLILIYYSKHKLIFYLQKLINNIITINNLIVIILFISFIIRILWIVLIETIPVSDFSLMYNSSQEVFNKNYNCFHGVNYFARFTHNTIPILYYSIFFNFNDNPLFLIKFVNVLFSTLSIFIMYCIIKQLLDYKSAIISSILFSLFPPFIMYNSQILSENIAIPLYLISIYFLLKYINNINKYKWIIFSGLSLSVANMFRMVGLIFLIAYLVYLLIYEKFKNSLKPILITIVTFILPLYITSSFLINNGITESHLWNPKETVLTSVLKGTNLNSFGFWNEEDSNLPIKYGYDYNKVKEESIRLIKQRLLYSDIKNVIALYIGKLSGELGVSDFGSFQFTVISSSKTFIAKALIFFEFTILTLINIFHIFLLYFSIIALNKNKNLLNELNLFLLISLGFTLFYLISEVQPRYSFIHCWILIIFSVVGLKAKFSTKSSIPILPSKYYKQIDIDSIF